MFELLTILTVSPTPTTARTPVDRAERHAERRGYKLLTHTITLHAVFSVNANSYGPLLYAILLLNI